MKKIKRIRLVRVYGNDNESVGILSVNGSEKNNCFTLEDEYQAKKVYGETRIDAGTYNIRVRTNGRMNEKYLKRFPDLHKGMLELQDVPNFKYIYIHIGNTDADTSGCILVGRKLALRNGRFSLEDSTTAYKKFYEEVIDYALEGKLVIQIV